jgi:Flp pilus assembly protein TadD
MFNSHKHVDLGRVIATPSSCAARHVEGCNALTPIALRAGSGRWCRVDSFLNEVPTNLSRFEGPKRQVKKQRQMTQAVTPRPRQELNAQLTPRARASRAWTFSAFVLASIALISVAIYLSTPPKPRGSIPSGKGPAGLSTALPLGAQTNRSAVIVLKSAPDGSNWDAVIAGRQKANGAIELAVGANSLLAVGDAKGAVRVLEEALRLKPEDEDLHYNLGIAYVRSGDITNAEHHYREALRLLPDYPEVHNNLGNLLLHAGRLGEAEEQFTEAIKLMPELSTAHNNLGTVRQRQNRMPEAIACFRKAVEYNTNYWQAHYNLAIASLSQGSKEEGLHELQTVLRLKPDYKPAQSALEKILANPSRQGP